MAVTKGGKARLFAQGHPLVFNGALDRIVGRPPPHTGDCIVLADGAERVIGWGVYNSVSMYRVRCAARRFPCAARVLPARVGAKSPGAHIRVSTAACAAYLPAMQCHVPTVASCM